MGEQVSYFPVLHVLRGMAYSNASTSSKAVVVYSLAADMLQHGWQGQAVVMIDSSDPS